MKKTWCKIGEEFGDGENVNVGRAVDVWISKPHTVNRRLCGVKVVDEGNVSCHCDLYNYDLSNACCCHAANLYDKVSCQLLEKNSDSVTSELLDIVKKCDDGERESAFCSASNRTFKFWVRTLLPKRIDKFRTVKEIVLVDDDSCWALFIPLFQENGEHYVTPPHLYGLHWKNSENKIELWVHSTSQEPSILREDASVVWLQTHLLPRLKKWSESQPTNSSGSLKLVPVDRYNELYQKLKIKHGPYLVENWPERTDPSKFVYEDIAIASYLLLLWEQERLDKELKTKQSFLDLGCGNGLLVYILTREGHPGTGLDIRKRKVWDLFGADVELKVASITPSPETTYPQYNWLIGNHSDELTPWIPVMAARSKFSTNFFLLPCCAHDFDSKFQRVGSELSQYRSYLDYVQQVAEICGFQVEEDRLRIPSTKRICFVGMRRTYSEDKENEVDKRRQDFILSRCKNGSQLKPLSVFPTQCTQSSNSSVNGIPEKSKIFTDSSENVCGESVGSMWATNFQARSAVEPVRNCTRVNKDVVAKIVGIVASELLAVTNTNFVEVVSEGGPLRRWNAGRRIDLSSLVALIEKDDLLQLKNECGGLQTLLKNHSHIFSVYQGTVGFKNYSVVPSANETKPRKPKLPSKPRPCWFHLHHPNGCPVLQSQCKFTH